MNRNSTQNRLRSGEGLEVRVESPKAEYSVTSDHDIWEHEYNVTRIIPSTYRTSPSKALLLFDEIIDYLQIQKVLDLGCGKGRNTIYLAQKGCKIFALDFSETALSVLAERAIEESVQGQIHLLNSTIDDHLPFRSGLFDLIVDSYVFCHLTEYGAKYRYREEIHRVLSDKGTLFLSLPSGNDEYYARFVTDTEDGRAGIVVDPQNGVRKQLYSPQEIKEFFSKDFDLLYFTQLEFSELILGIPYRRSILALVLQH